MALGKISEALLGKRLDPFSGQTRLAYAAVIGKIELHQRSVVLCVPAKTGVHTETTGRRSTGRLQGWRLAVFI